MSWSPTRFSLSNRKFFAHNPDAFPIELQELTRSKFSSDDEIEPLDSKSSEASFGIMENDSTVTSCGIRPEDYLLLMIVEHSVRCLFNNIPVMM
jgi:hypothetical protein